MKSYLLALSAVTVLGIYTQGAAQAQSYRGGGIVVERGDHREYNEGSERRGHHDGRGRRHFRTKTVYVIEGGRPVQRVLFVDDRGRYFREERGQQIFIQERVFESYPARYYHRDGRRRAGITLELN